MGPGDDAAVLVGSGPVVVTTDALVDGQHFRLDWSTPRQVGAKAVVANAADVMSMGARVTGFVVSLTCPDRTPTTTLVGVRDGMREAAARYGAQVVGGDLTAGDQLVIAVTAVVGIIELKSHDWQGEWINMIGCVAFAVSALGAFVSESGVTADAWMANLGTFIGALCFLVAALVMLPRRAQRE